MIERQVIVTWYMPEEKLPPEDEDYVVTFSGKDGSITYDHVLGVGTWFGRDGWYIRELSEDAEFTIHAWADLESYKGE